MSILQSIKIATSALKANKLRAALTMLGLIIGVWAVILLVGLGAGVGEEITSQIEDIGANLIIVIPGKLEEVEKMTTEGPPTEMMGAIAASTLTNENLEAIREKCSTCKNVFGVTMAGGTVSYKKNKAAVIALGTNPPFAKVRNIDMEKGKFLDEKSVEREKKVCVLGNKLAKDLFFREEAIGKKIKLNEEDFKVIGVTESIGTMGTAEMGIDYDEMMYIPLTVVQKLAKKPDKINRLVAQATSSETVDGAQEEVRKILLREHKGTEDFSVLTQKDMLKMLDVILGMVTVMLAGIASISLVVGGIGIMNIMLVSVTERTREIGIRKAVGAKNNDILGQFLTEAVALSLLGGGIGVALAYISGLIISPYLDFDIAIQISTVFLAFGISAGIGIVFGTAPAVRASKLDPIEALRYE